MKPFVSFATQTAPLPQANVDTDQIIPARFLQKPRREGCGPYLFHDLRANPEFVLNDVRYKEARVLVAGENFGCGSSRENAVWALYDYGFRAVIAPSFGDIFLNNSLKNGLLPIVLPAELVAHLLIATPVIRVDLDSQTVSFEGDALKFEIDPFAKHCLLNGVDELGYTLSRLQEIEAFEAREGK
jgi:3-isopropylmalate/(R)-2-methylmalate dehydratase small subunit